MRPLRLRFQAFGPFASPMDIDFTTFGTQTLFGIYGPTGSGKTSILDALSFALFGVPTGEDRDPEDLRSHYASAETKTFVELIFALGEKRYFVRREPAQERTKKRGEGSVFAPHRAYLFDVSMVPVANVSFEKKPGEVICEKKTGPVDAQIEHLLGYTKKQFRQIMILPQGAFRAFLTAPGPQRSKILRQLFDTAPFQQLTETLKTRRSALLKDLSHAQTAMSTVLEGVHLPGRTTCSKDELLVLISDWEKQKKALAEKEKTAEIEQKTVANSLASAHAAEVLFKEDKTARDAVTQFENQMDAYERKKVRHESARRAAKLTEEDTKLQAANSELASAVQRVNQLAQALHTAETEKKKAKTLLLTLKKKQAEQKKMAAQLLDFHRYGEVLEQLAGKRCTFADLKHQVKSCTAALKISQKALSKAEKLEDNARQAKEQVGLAKTSNSELSLKVERLRTQKTAVLQLQKINQTLAKKKEQIDTKIRQQKTAKTAFLKLDQRLSTLDQKRSEDIIKTLSETLKDGTPCPVCGATDHFGRTTAGGTKKNFETEPPLTELRAAHEQQNEELHTITHARILLEAEIRQLEQRITEFPKTKKDLSLNDLEAELRPLEQALKLAKNTVATEQKVEDSLILARNEITQKAPLVAKQTQELQTIETDLVRLEAELSTALETVPEALQDPQVLKIEREKLTKNLALAESSFKAADSKFAGIREQVQVLSARRQDAEKQKMLREKQVEKATEKLENTAKIQGFTSIDLYRSYKLGPNELEALAKEIELFLHAKSAAQARAERAAAATLGLTKLDVAEIEAQMLAATDVLKSFRERLTLCGGELVNLKKAKTQYEMRQKIFEDTDTQLREIGTLADIAEGKAPNKLRISLIDWVLGAYFEDVLQAANLRFDRMSRGRYELRRRQDPALSRKASGLDIMVFDAFTGQERPARTLSGGESFLAALALALGLSDVVQTEVGGVRLDAILIDEGFGQLDDEALEHALSTLMELSGGNKIIGLISHVPEVQRLVPMGIEVTPGPEGSSLTLHS